MANASFSILSPTSSTSVNMNAPVAAATTSGEPSKSKKRKSVTSTVDDVEHNHGTGSDSFKKAKKSKSKSNDEDERDEQVVEKKEEGDAVPKTPSSVVKKSPATPATADNPKNGYCHHCHRGMGVIVCTLMKSIGKKVKRCRVAFCDRCLRRNYGNSIDAIHAAGKPKDFRKVLGHDSSENYYFRCPVCEKKCQCSNHRPKDNTEENENAEAGAKPSEVAGTVNDTPLRNKGKADEKAKEKELPKKEAPKKKEKTMETKEESKAKTETKEAKKKPAAKKRKKKDEATDVVVKPDSTLKLVAVSGPMPPPVIQKPKLLENPKFEFIAISHQEPVIELRLQIREFYLRFEKHTKLLVKYARIINDPNSDWTNLTYKNLINMLVNILANDKKTLSEKRSVSDTTLLLEESANALNLTPADSPEIWSITITLIGYWYGAKKMPAYDSDMHNEESKLRIVCILMCLALQTHTYHQWLDADAASEKKNKQSCVDEIKRLKTEWEAQRQILQKERLTLPATHKVEFEIRYHAAQNACKTLIRSAEMKEWFAARKTAPRYTPLGVDVLGNTYHLFIQRDPREEDWGSWVVVEKGKFLPHPSGVLPPPPSISSDPGADQEEEDQEQEEYDEAEIRKRVWYAVSEPQDIHHLADWIKYKGDLAMYYQETRVRPLTPASSVPASPSCSNTPTRQFLAAINIPSKKGGVPITPVAKEDYMPLVEKVHRIAEFFELSQNPVV